MGLITSAGVGSGIDIESIIGAILNAERAPKEASLQRNELRVDSTLSAIGQLSSALSSLNDALDNLNTIADFQLAAATVSEQDVLSIITDENTSPGSFTLDNITLASGSRLESLPSTFTDITDTVGQGTLTFTAGSNTFDVTVDSTDDLDSIRDNINANADNFGVTANIINSANGPILVFNSDITGSGNTLVVTNDDASLDSISTSLTTPIPASSASVDIDGITVSSDTNTFSNAIQDVTFTVLSDSTPSVNLDIAADTEGVKDAIQAFVNAVNAFQTTAQSLGQNSESVQGELAGDATLRILVNQVVTDIQDSVTGLTGDYTSLNSIGVTFDEFGQLTIDEDLLDTVIASDFDVIGDIFATDTEGVSIKLQQLVDNYNGSGGILEIRESSLNDQKRRLEDDRLNFEFRIAQVETQLRAKFGAMDALVASFNSTGAFLSAQLSNLPGSRSE